jgi:hypothetical protein
MRSFRALIQNLPTLPGVYIIEYTPTNQLYIGCTTRTSDYGIKTRVAHHFDNLTRGVHPNKSMQEAWNKDSNLAHWVVEPLEITCNRKRENDFMKAFSIPNDYDFNKVGCRK